MEHMARHQVFAEIGGMAEGLKNSKVGSPSKFCKNL
jgi:hypothetical protein